MKREWNIQRGQIWKSKTNDMQVEVQRSEGGSLWKVRKLTNKTGKYNGSHTLTVYTLTKGFTLLK